MANNSGTTAFPNLLDDGQIALALEFRQTVVDSLPINEHTAKMLAALTGPEAKAALYNLVETGIVPEVALQFGVGEGSVAEDIVGLLEVMPDLERTGDRRSGIVVFDGAKLVANYTWSGKMVASRRSLYVDPDYRGSQLAPRMILEWSKRTKRPRDLYPIPISAGGAVAFLRADRMLYDWAEAEGRAFVPRDVVQREMAYLERQVAAVAQSGKPITIGPAMRYAACAPLDTYPKG